MICRNGLFPMLIIGLSLCLLQTEANKALSGSGNAKNSQKATVTAAKQSPKAQVKPQNRAPIQASSRSSELQKKREIYKVQKDFQNILNQHLLGPIPTGVSPKEDKPKGKLQTIGSVLGDIIGVLISEVSRFFGSVISDVAREVTAHGFVNVLRQFADLTGFGANLNSLGQNSNVHVG